MTTPPVNACTSLRSALERHVVVLLDQSKAEALRGNLTGATVRRIVARDLGELLAATLRGMDDDATS